MTNTFGQLVNNRDDILKFITGKRAWFTLKSMATGNTMEFKFKPSKKKESTKFISISIHGSYLIIGGISSSGIFRCRPIWTSHMYNEKPLPNTDLYYKSFTWFWNAVHNNEGLEKVEFYHVGMCSECGHKLTSPESIEIGIGPTCLKRIEERNS